MISAQVHDAVQSVDNLGGDSLLDALTSANYWAVGVITLISVVTCVLIHYEGLSFLNKCLPKLGHRPRRRVLFLIFILLAVHVTEIWLFAFAHRWAFEFPGVGELVGLQQVTMFDLVYYSAVVYTTVGFGDLVPTGPLRMLTGTEALAGLVLITWSASFTFLEMQHFWKGRD